MDTASLEFVGFGLIVAFLLNLHPTRKWRSIVLMLASLLFLFLVARNPLTLLPLAIFLLLGFVALTLINRGLSSMQTWSIPLIILVYIWLKKYTFLPEDTFLRFPYATLGLSYIFFRVLHLLIDCMDDKEIQSIGFGSYLLYTLNFTTLVSGPIQRYDEFARDQFANEALPLDAGIVGLQFERIIRGFFKVNVLAMILHAFQQDALARLAQPMPSGLKLFPAFELIVVYPFFLYANFSGYIDIVIALARLLRIRLPENFDRPFSAASFLDFWNRWHITLSSWLKRYVYNPVLLALMRRISLQSIRPFLGVVSFFVTFFLVGIWHGRTSEFVIFGVLQGGGVSINKLWQIGMARVMGKKPYKGLTENPLYVAFARGLTFSWFAFTLFWFWASWKQIGAIYSAVGALQWLGIWAAVWICATAILAFWEVLRAALLSIPSADGPLFTSSYARVIYGSVLGLIAIMITVVMNQPAPDVVYKAF